MRISRKLARKLAKMAAEAGKPFREFVNRALYLAATEKDKGIDFMISDRDKEGFLWNARVALQAKATGRRWKVWVMQPGAGKTEAYRYLLAQLKGRE